MIRSKSILGMSMAIMGTVVLMACGNSQKDKKNDAQLASASDGETIQTSTTKAQAQEILTAYLEVKDALVQTDGDAASMAATELISALGESKEALVEQIRFDAIHIAETKETKHQRDHFNTLSENIYTLIKATGKGEAPLYRQYCPMAFDNKGAFWLSAEKKVTNPYFGDKMLHCGSVKEVF